MLILVFRGIFLIGILSWYSSNVWKMIDGYFKDRFEKYLQEEYQKNPKMREDVDAYGMSDEKEKGILTRKEIPKRNIEERSCETLIAELDEETCPIEYASMEAVADAQAGSGSLSLTSGDGDTMNGGHASKCKVKEKVVVDKNNAYSKDSSGSRVESNSEELPTKDIGIDELTNIEPKLNKVEAATTKRNVRRRPDSLKVDVKKAINGKLTEGKSPRKKEKVKTIILTEIDFKEAKLRGGLQDYDFSEFDDDNDKNEDSELPPKGILVSQLPIKPRADIGNLDRVTHEEFCPLTFEDEINCGETKIWP